MSLAPTLAFLEQLAENNAKPWFDEHRGQYEEARAAFEQFIADVIARFQAVDAIGQLDPKDVIHRIYRDVRILPSSLQLNSEHEPIRLAIDKVQQRQDTLQSRLFRQLL